MFHRLTRWFLSILSGGGGMPAIARGYLDRVFSHGFAYLNTDKGPLGLLNKKRIIIINTVGATEQEYRNNTMTEALELVIAVDIIFAEVWRENSYAIDFAQGVFL